jgi:hypothetical protein
VNNGSQDVNQWYDEVAHHDLHMWQSVANAMLREYLDNADIGKGPIMSANEKQVGGSHYRNDIGGEQHWDRIYRLYGRGYFVGCSTKYIERYHLKNGRQDLEKAIHFLEKLIELEYGSENCLESLDKKLGEMANATCGIPDHLKEYAATERQQEVAAKFDDLREKHMNAVSPMLQRVLQDKEWKIDSSEPQAQGYVNQDGENETYSSMLDKLKMSSQYMKPAMFGTVTNDGKTV